VRTSVVAGRGLEDLKSELIRMLAETALPRHLGKPRLPVDRAFSLQGIGTVVTGTLAGGTLLRGQQVVLQPSGRATRVRALQNHLHDVEQCGPGMRTALNLPDVMAGQTARRGDVVTLPDLGGPSDTVHVLLEKSSRLAESSSRGARPLKDGVLARMHHGSGNWPARIVLSGRGPLRPGQSLLAELRFETPVFVMAGDRFIVRDWSEQATLGGGVVLDPHGDRGEFREDSRRAALEERAAAPRDAGVAVATELRMRSMVRADNLLRQACFGAEEIQNALRQMERDGTAVRIGEWIAEASWWSTVRDRAAQCIHGEHENHPERPGLALNELRARLESHLPSAEVFPVLTADLGRHGFVQEGTNIRDQSHRPALPESLQTAGQKLRTALQQNPFEPPTKKDLLAIPQAAPALQFLIEAGEAVPISDDTVMAADALRNATDRIRRYLKNQGGASASELRQILKTSRRVIIPLLERLDKEGVTMRQGDQRVLKTEVRASID
jgi:selenocysteine-specific elongation factor